MATYFVTSSDTATWDDDRQNRLKTRRIANERVRELLATHPRVRLIRWERGRPVKEEQFTAGHSLS